MNAIATWTAHATLKDCCITIVKDGIDVACIMPEQVIHGMEYCEPSDLVSELQISYNDILDDLGITVDNGYIRE